MNQTAPVTVDAPVTGRHELWLLALVPNVKNGRWWFSLVALGVTLLLFGAAGTLTDPGSWSAALFFCASLAYIPPVFHYITRGTEEAFDALVPSLSLPGSELATLRAGISGKGVGWYLVNTVIAFAGWMLQSWLLAGSLDAMMQTLGGGPTHSAMAIGPLFVWLFTTCAVHALIDNARLFRQLGRLVDVDLLNTRRLRPFGSMAVSSTLMVIGAQALFPIMWLGPETDIWTTVPPLIPTTLALLFLFFAPVWPIHLAIRGIKQAELERIQGEIKASDGDGAGARDYEALAPLLVYRREIASTPEWPFDLSIVARFGLYLVIVPLTWIGAALIEILVDVFLA